MAKRNRPAFPPKPTALEKLADIGRTVIEACALVSFISMCIMVAIWIN